MEPLRRAVVIEDDDDIRHLLETVLNQAGFEVTARSNGYDGIEAVRAVVPTVVTLDVNMPGIDGFETAKRIRTFSDAYIVMLTALGEEIDTLQGLEAGADDYVTKPFRPRELRARIEAMLRRPRAAAPVAPATSDFAGRPPAAPAYTAVSPGAAPASTPPAAAGERLEHLGLVVDLGTRVAIADGQEIPLTRSEFDLLAALLQSGRRVRTKADLAILLRNESYVTSNFVSDADKRGIEVHMGNLRKKIGENSLTPRWIETVRGVGYRMTGVDGAI
ncbi:response regulator transcription factor [Pseudolysinimonas sp.]|jgi:two-component system OmpR family response regulator|uniref:response regulator transcription factor n=1 Tax=Pseudolysinimonas sp. TaxID=2680009 RepID=UPI003785230F